MERVEVLGVGVHSVSVAELHAEIQRTIGQGERSLILYANTHALNLSYHDSDFRASLNQASIVLCDGIGAMLGARLLGHPIRQRIPLTELIWQLAEFAEPRGFTFFFLGARPSVADNAAARLKVSFPSLDFVGVHHGYFNKTAGNPENEEVVRMINAAKPDILIVGFGMPLQERWLAENWGRLEARIALSGGAVFDYTSGELQRGPRWMTDNGLEWLSRLMIEPRRLWKRYIVGNPIFLLRVLKERLKAIPFGI
jgi:N-acetylglucosaminyldiphosphoundecaprenol N-acetyl-beta-D-mannosaminyltransferase